MWFSIILLGNNGDNDDDNDDDDGIECFLSFSAIWNGHLATFPLTAAAATAATAVKYDLCVSECVCVVSFKNHIPYTDVVPLLPAQILFVMRNRWDGHR